MEPIEKTNLLNRFFDYLVSNIGRERHVPAKVIAYLVIFISIGVIQAINSDNAINGLLSQMQVLASVFLVLTAGKRGFQAVVFAGVMQIISVMIHIIAMGDIRALPGAMIPVVNVIVLAIILVFSRKLINEIQKESEQSDSLGILNEELANRERDAIRHSELLTEYNRVMKENEDRLYHLINYDTLTELPNRVKINDRIELLISLLSHKKMGFSLFYVDLDHFKRINDSVSHHVGDLMLQAVSSRLRLIIHPDDMIGRLGGDEFVVVVQRQLKEEELLLYSEGIRNSLSEMFTVENLEYSISASFGIAMYPSDGEDAAELMKNAETAMYKSKEFGRNGVQFFRREMKDDIMRKVKYESGLMASIQNNELYLVFQPQYNTKTKKLRGFESLARWENETLGAVSPVQFIPVAEEGGFIVPLGEWILEAACSQLNSLLEIYGKELIMSVNISAVQIMSPSFVNSVKRILFKTKCKPENLEFEITESVMISSVDYVINVLNQLKDLGIRIALDDFGTGYSSLSYLQMLPIETLKIDKSFVDNMMMDENHRTIVGSIISLVHQMDMEVVAEGVDNPSQLEFLNNFQCDFIQGYIWGRPLREEEVLKLLRDLNDEDLLIP